MLGGVPNVGGSSWKKSIFFWFFFFFEFFFSNFSCFAFFKFSHSWTTNSMRQRIKGSVPFLLPGCENITAQCKKWHISFQASYLRSLLKESCIFWQIQGMYVDFFSTLSIGILLSALVKERTFLAFLRIGNCLSFLKLWQFYFKFWIWIFFSLLFSWFAFFQFSHCWTINSMRQMQKGQFHFCCQGVRISLPNARNDKFLSKPHYWVACWKSLV